MPKPTITSITPNTGSIIGQTPVLILGTNFLNAGNPVTQVTFDGLQAVFTRNSDTSITATTPAHSQGGNVPVVVINGDGACVVPGSFNYINLKPSVAQVSPTQGPTSGGTVVSILGTNFTIPVQVTFDGFTAASVVNSPTSITATSPAHAAGGPFHVRVTNNNGTSNENGPADHFSYVAVKPKINSVSPAQGPITGGTPVLILGENFDGVTFVAFDGLQAVFTRNSSTSISAISPANTAGDKHIQVTSNNGASDLVAADIFRYVVAKPIVQMLAPSTGPTAGGMIVFIQGNNFAGTTQVTFGGFAATGVVINSNTSISCTAPTHGAGQVEVLVTNSNGTSDPSPGSKYTYV